MTSNDASPESGAPGRWPGAEFTVEFDGDEVCPHSFAGDPGVLLFFMSWAYSVRFGGMHELAQAALHLQRKHKVDLRPLLTYADEDIEDEDDQHAYDHSWQDCAPLASASRAVADALDADDADLEAFTGEYEPALQERLRELAAMCDWGAERGARVRLTFHLDA